MTLLALAVAAVAGTLRYAARQRRLLHLLQLEHYENSRLGVWLRRRDELLLRNQVALTVALLAALAVALAVGIRGLGAAVGLVLAAAMVTWSAPDLRRREITPLVFTARAKRLYGLAVGIVALPTLVALGASFAWTVPAAAALAAAVAAIGCHAAPWLLTAANRALKPVQRRINQRFADSARERLELWQPLVVGVTGSYGKTTTKFCIGTMLAESRRTLVTPESFNSYLGVIRTINENLQPDDRAFVVEMGMFRRGDIRELCELVEPQIGVITAIGPAHLERLGSMEEIAAAKAELMESLPAHGHLIANGDDTGCRAIVRRAHVAVTLYGMEHANATVRAENAAVAHGRTTFDLVVDGARRPMSVALLGRHNISNLLAAAAVGHVLGIPIEQIAAGLERVEPPAHRLQPIHNATAGVVVIDDAYNSNPTGAKAALEVLREHPAKRRILVTPGMVELGAMEEELNAELGRQAAEVCDHVILVGPARTRPIAAGLRAAGMPVHAITVAHDIHDATRVLHGMTRAGDVILFENDLPDTYAEEKAEAAVVPEVITTSSSTTSGRVAH